LPKFFEEKTIFPPATRAVLWVSRERAYLLRKCNMKQKLSFERRITVKRLGSEDVITRWRWPEILIGGQSSEVVSEHSETLLFLIFLEITDFLLSSVCDIHLFKMSQSHTKWLLCTLQRNFEWLQAWILWSGRSRFTV